MDNVENVDIVEDLDVVDKMDIANFAQIIWFIYDCTNWMALAHLRTLQSEMSLIRILMLTNMRMRKSLQQDPSLTI